MTKSGFFCEIARQTAASWGRIDREALGLIVSRVTGRKDADGYVDHLIAHPFISQEEFSKRGVADFRFDFMPEYFRSSTPSEDIMLRARSARTTFVSSISTAR